MKSLLILAALGAATAAQPPQAARDKVNVALEVRTEGRPTRDQTASRLFDDVRRGLEASGDVEVNPRAQARRIIWIVSGAAGPPYAASMMVTERYDRETLMVLGIEEDDIAERMMSLQIVNDHQIFTDADPASLARRIVTALTEGEGVLNKLRLRKPRH